MSDAVIDRYLASNLGRLSPRELSEETGVPEAEVISRADAYYDSVVITAPQRRAKLLIQLEEIVSESIERAKNSNSRDSSGNANSAIAAIKALNKEIDDAAKREEGSNEATYARIMVRIVEASFNRSIGELNSRFPELATKDVEATFRKHLLEVSREYDGER